MIENVISSGDIGILQYKWNANSFLFLLLFFFSAKKKRSVTPCETGCLLWRGNPSTSFAGSPPLSGEALCTNLQTPYKIRLTAYIRKTLEYQHSRYRQGQQPALASPRRTASATSEFRRTVSTRLHEKLYCTEEPLHQLRWSPSPFRGGLCISPRGDVGIAFYTFQTDTTKRTALLQSVL